MEFVLNHETNGIDFGRYSAYVESIRSKLPAHVYVFASNPAHFNLDSHSSLHDAWLESLNVREIAEGKRKEIRRLEIQLCLLGPFHDRWIHLHYAEVTQYSLHASPNYSDQRNGQIGHGDLLAHEIRLGRDGLLLHELLFERDSRLLIECADIRHSEETI